MRPILIIILAMFSGLTVRAGGIRLVSTKVVEDPGSVPYVLRNITTQPVDMDVDEPNGVDIWIRHPPGGHGDKPFIVNKDGSVAAINIRPATKWEMVYLLLSFKDSNITIISDFNERVAKLCAAAKKDINDREIEIEEIDGDVLHVWSSEYKEAIFDLQIRVLPSGQLQLIHYKETPF